MWSQLKNLLKKKKNYLRILVILSIECLKLGGNVGLTHNSQI